MMDHQEKLKFTPMSEEEFDAWFVQSRENYIRENMKFRNFSKKFAEEFAERQLKELLPQGKNTPEHYFYTAKTADSEETNIGVLWFQLRKQDEKRQVFLLDIVVEEKFRSRGFGRLIMNFLETESQRLEAHAIALHVFAGNSHAVSLYQSLGFIASSMLMERPLAQ